MNNIFEFENKINGQKPNLFSFIGYTAFEIIGHYTSNVTNIYEKLWVLHHYQHTYKVQ